MRSPAARIIQASAAMRKMETTSQSGSIEATVANADKTLDAPARTVVFRARFMLIGSMNQCPCGFLGDTVRQCRCTAPQIATCRDRLSGPLRDGLDRRREPTFRFDS